MFTILKPEMKRCVGALDPYLESAGFTIASRHPISDWEKTARGIYAPQLRDLQFTTEFNAYLWMTQSLFGNNAVAYQLSRNNPSGQNIETLMSVKDQFRRDISASFDGPVNFLVDMDKLETLQPKRIGKVGAIHINDSPLKNGSFEGRWDYFFLKYIHTSDDYENLARETEVLEKNGTFDKEINKSQWDQMIHHQSLIQPMQGETTR